MPTKCDLSQREICTQFELLDSLPFHRPWLEAQHAIVARVDKLLAMVDQLAKQVAERREQAEQLMQAVLREAFG